MTTRPLLDTHAWLWWLDGSGRLTPSERRGLDRLAEEETPPLLCGISLWEVAVLVARERVVLDRSFDDWIDLGASSHAVALVDVSPEIAKEILRLPSTFHNDPADRIIVATARVLDVPVLTRDAAIRKAGLVRLWKP